MLCDLHSKETGSKWDGLIYDGVAGTLSKSLKDWAGLPERLPLIPDGEGGLADHNDGVLTNPKSFPEIADLIEKYL